MAQVIADGPLGLEAKHRWIRWDGVSLLPYDLNARQHLLPRYRIDKLTGFHSLPEADDARAPRVAQLGEIPYPSGVRGKTIVYEGRIMGSTLQEMRSLSAALRKTFAHRNAEGYMRIIPDAAYGSQEWAFFARVMQLDIDDEQTRGPTRMPTPYQREFVLGLRCSDPRFYVWPGPASSGPHASGDQVTITNQGTAPTDPIFTVTVPAGNPTITFQNLSVPTPGGSAQMRFVGVPAGAMHVDFRRRTADVGGLDVMPLIDVVYTDWLDENVEALGAGGNEVIVTGGTWTVTWYHAAY